MMLGLAGYRTALFEDAETLLAGWQSEWAGCLVTDLRLPGMSGSRGCRRSCGRVGPACLAS